MQVMNVKAHFRTDNHPLVRPCIFDISLSGRNMETICLTPTVQTASGPSEGNLLLHV